MEEGRGLKADGRRKMVYFSITIYRFLGMEKCFFLCFYFSRTNTFCKFATKYTKGTTMVGTLRVSDVYMDILSTLPNEDKLDIISRLVQSMKKAVTVKKSRKTFLPVSPTIGEAI